MQHLVSDDAARGIELAVTPVVFGGLGWVVDAQVGTGPWLAIAFGTFAVVGTIAKMWFGYDAEMRRLESSGRWARHADRPATGPAPSSDLWADRKAQA